MKSATQFLYVKTSSGKVVVQPFPCLTLQPKISLKVTHPLKKIAELV